MEREPSKRKIKPPAFSKFINVDDIFDESSSDSDFRIEDHCVNSESDSDRASHLTYTDDDSSSEETDTDVEDKAGCSKNMVTNDSTSMETTSQENPKKANLKEIVDKIRICSICLVDASDDVSDLKDCDECGISVHEGCYGKNDSESVSSLGSTCSKESWFCDTCKAGIENPTCELCPNIGGVFKETDCRKWVHLVCALYVPGITFGDTTSLTKIMLFPNSSPRWGYKNCTLCEDVRFVRTGVTIACDAGMCKSNFHVTCAQQEGCLSEVTNLETDQLDPFYAHCKLHVDKLVVKKKKRNWKALQFRTKQIKLLREKQSSKKSAIWLRNQQRLQKLQSKYKEMNKLRSVPELTQKSKVPRPIITSASSCQALWLKASLMGINMASCESIEKSIVSIRDTPKKWHIPPAFSLEFVSYFFDRNLRLKDLKKQSNQYIEKKNQLQDNLAIVQEKYDQVIKNNAAQKQKYLELQNIIRTYHYVLSIGNPDARLPDVDSLTKEGSNNHVFTPDAVKRFPAIVKDNEMSLVLNNECGICGRTNDQHLLSKCDKCCLYYHLGCLNPPLTRMPKKTKLFGWQCCECDNIDSGSKPDVVDLNAPRKLRQKARDQFLSGSQDFVDYDVYSFTERGTSPVMLSAKNHERRVGRYSPEIIVKKQIKSRKRKRKHNQKNSTLVVKSDSDLTDEPPREGIKLFIKSVPSANGEKTKSSQLLNVSPVVNISPVSIPIKTKPEKSVEPIKITSTLTDIKVPSKCTICNTATTNSTVVQCDECCKHYHLGCLDPPLKKSPKVCGYSWHCAECDPTESDSSS